MLGKGRLFIKHLQVKPFDSNCSQLNKDIVEKMFLLLNTVQLKSLFVSKIVIAVRFE